jgi:CPA1 family monovalent cation:H+ antiporter
VLALSRERVSDAVKAMAVDYKFPDAVVSYAIKSRAGEDLSKDVAAAAQEGAEDRRLPLGLIALASHERELVLSHFAERTVSGKIVEQLLTSLGQLIDRTRVGGQAEYISGAHQIVDFSRRFRIAHFLHRRLSFDGPLVDRLADRFELLLLSLIVLEELDSYLGKKLSPLVGEKATATIGVILHRRSEMTATALNALRQQYPTYAELLECRILEKIWLRREEMEYRALFEDGVIGPELYTTLRREVSQLRAKVEVRPRLDLGLETRALVSKVPIFATLTEEQLDSVARLLRPRFAVPGERLIRDCDVADAMYFLSSGAVQVHVVGTNIKLGSGDFFGEMALVTGQRRQGDVDAIGYCQLLVLSRDAYRDFLRRNPLLQERISAVANARVIENKEAVSKNPI